MKIKSVVIVISIILNIMLISYVYLKQNHLTGAYSNLSFELQHDLIQLESAINYQMDNNWNDENSVIEKIEDVRENISFLMSTGKDLGVISKSQEKDLWNLYKYFIDYPMYSGYPNTMLTNEEVNELIALQKHLRSAGWGMNIGYSSDWESFSKKIDSLLK